MPEQKWQARTIGAVVIGALSFVLMMLSPTPPEVVLFGLIAGAIAGGAVWEQSKQR